MYSKNSRTQRLEPNNIFKPKNITQFRNNKLPYFNTYSLTTTKFKYMLRLWYDTQQIISSSDIHDSVHDWKLNIGGVLRASTTYYKYSVIYI